MPYNGTNPVSVGLTAKANQYNRVFDNTVAIHGGEIALAGQVAGDLMVAISATQWGRSPSGILVPGSVQQRIGASTFDGTNWHVNLQTGAAFRFDGVGSFAVLFDNPPAAGLEFVFSVQIDWTGAGAPSWPAPVTWDEDTAPTLNAVAGRTAILGFSTLTGGARWRGYLAGRNFTT